MSDEAVKAALVALAHAELPGSPTPAERLVWKAALRRRLERSARGSPTLTDGLPAAVVVVCAAAFVLLPRLVATYLSPAAETAIWLAQGLFGVAVAASAAQLLFRR